MAKSKKQIVQHFIQFPLAFSAGPLYPFYALFYPLMGHLSILLSSLYNYLLLYNFLLFLFLIFISLFNNVTDYYL